MSPDSNSELAPAAQQERRRRGRAPAVRAPATDRAVTIRPAIAADQSALARLAQLDCSHVPSGSLLVAEVEGELLAAVPVIGDEVIADPFVRTAEITVLLRARAAQLRPHSGGDKQGGLVRRCLPLAAVISPRLASAT